MHEPRSITAPGGPVMGVGLDLVEVDRVRHAIERYGERFLERVFTDAERAYCQPLPQPWPHYAARFAVKEAVAKCLGTGIGAAFGWRSVGVVHDEAGAPLAELDANANACLEARGAARVLLSLTHTRDHAQAIALLIGHPPG